MNCFYSKSYHLFNYIVSDMNIHQFAKLINECSDSMTEEELDVLTDQWLEEYELYLLKKVKQFTKSKI